MDLSSSHKKFSGQVLIVCISQGIANPFWSSPLFHNHLAEQFSAQSASLIAFYSVKASFNYVLETTCLSISSWISSRALFTSSVSIKNKFHSIRKSITYSTSYQEGRKHLWCLTFLITALQHRSIFPPTSYQSSKILLKIQKTFKKQSHITYNLC